MKTILFPTDFSNSSIQAIKYGIELFGNIDECKFIIAHAYETPQAGATMLISIDKLFKDEVSNRLKKLRADLSVEYSNIDLRVSLTTFKGTVITMIRKIAKQEDIDFVVMGTKGSSGIREVVIGSTTFDVVKNSKLPIIVVPDHAVLKSPKKVVFASDLSDISKKTLKPLYGLVEASGASIDVLNIVTEKAVVAEEVNSFQDDNISSKFFGLYGHTYHQINGEDVEKAILNYIDENETDLLCVVNKKRNFFEGIMHSSVSKKLAFHSQTPLLILKES